MKAEKKTEALHECKGEAWMKLQGCELKVVVLKYQSFHIQQNNKVKYKVLKIFFQLDFPLCIYITASAHTRSQRKVKKVETIYIWEKNKDRNRLRMETVKKNELENCYVTGGKTLTLGLNLILSCHCNILSFL